MVFSSVTFLFLFLPLFLACYFMVRRELRNVVLLLFSLFFYFWGEGAYTLVMIAYMIANYLFGIAIERAKAMGDIRGGKLSTVFFLAAMVFNLGLLLFCKY